jgi:integrase/recombinase XerC
MTPAHVGVILSRLLGPGWAAHSLRHRAATDLHDDTKDLLLVRDLLGHQSSATTEIYVQTRRDALWDAMRRRRDLPDAEAA